MRFRTVPGQLADEVPEGSSADSRQRVPVQMTDKVPEGFGAES